MSAESVLLVGNGGREHAMAEEMARSDELERIYVTSPNAGMLAMEKVVGLDIKPGDMNAIASFADAHWEGLTVVVGPEGPLVAGLADELEIIDVPVFGPTAEAAWAANSAGNETLATVRDPQPRLAISANRPVAPATGDSDERAVLPPT